MKSILISLALALGLAGVARAETILTSTESLKETKDYSWLLSETIGGGSVWYTFAIDSNDFYRLEKTTETREVEYLLDGQYRRRDIYFKYRKVYYPISWTQCVEWELTEYLDLECHELWERYHRYLNPCEGAGPCMKPAIYMEQPKCVDISIRDCKRELVYFEDGRVAWRDPRKK